MFFSGLFEELTSRLSQAKYQIGYTAICQLLNKKYQDETQLCAPLLVSAKEGHVEICDLLIYEYGVDIETEGLNSINCRNCRNHSRGSRKTYYNHFLTQLKRK